MLGVWRIRLEAGPSDADATEAVGGISVGLNPAWWGRCSGQTGLDVACGARADPDCHKEAKHVLDNALRRARNEVMRMFCGVCGHHLCLITGITNFALNLADRYNNAVFGSQSISFYGRAE